MLIGLDRGIEQGAHHLAAITAWQSHRGEHGVATVNGRNAFDCGCNQPFA